MIEQISAELDGGRFAAKATRSELVEIEADIFADGHDRLAARLRVRKVDTETWTDIPMEALVNDRWRASFTPDELGFYECRIEAWIDPLATWQAGLAKKVEAGLEVQSELLEGAQLLRAAAARARGQEARRLGDFAAHLLRDVAAAERLEIALAEELLEIAAAHPDRSRAAVSASFRIEVERERASRGAWYELFPRSAAADPGRHGTLADVEKRLDYVAAMGFDVVYLPPIHPIGRTYRKGPNNQPLASPGDPGSPWGIGAAEGGHTAVHPELGTLADFDRLVASARARNIEIALDVAFQTSPDHPWVREHPEWFRHRPDGTIQYAENPPKKYQDIYPIDFDTPAWRELWEELLGVVRFWIGHGVRIFRVDNPHTKPFRFWEWLIREARSEHPDVVFLSEAFTRPKIMRHLAKCGFSQSYTYFTWRNGKAELTEYFTELNEPRMRFELRPNLFVNTPDILHAYLQDGGRPAFAVRVVLAATLAASYGIYGPAFELCEGRAVPGTEEYVDSEKYQVRHWEIERPDDLRGLIRRLNEIRRTDPALRCDRSLSFHGVDNDQLLFYSKTTPDQEHAIWIIANLDPHHPQAGWVDVPIERFGLDEDEAYVVHDLLSDARYPWRGRRNFVLLDPGSQPAHVFRLLREAPPARSVRDEPR